MADTDLELSAQRVRQLEAEAMEMHDRAQQFNKEGRFAEAQAAYAHMHRLEDEASALAAQVGCVACVLGDDADPEDAGPSLCNLDMDSLLPYQCLHPALRWPATAAAAEGAAGATSSSSAEQQQQQALLASRSVAAVVGSALADAAAMGVHWVYDLAVLDQLEEERRPRAAATTANSHTPAASLSSSSPAAAAGHPFSFGLEFMDPPRSPFYAYASGRNSPYGEQTLALLRSMAESGGLDCDHYSEVFAAAFGPDSGFDGYRDVSTKGFLRNHARAMPPPLTGANDAQANCIARLAPLIAAFATSPSAAAAAAPAAGGAGAAAVVEAEGGLLHCVELATRVTQNTDTAVAWACVGAAVLELVLLGWRAEAAVRHVLLDLQSPQGRLAPFCGDLASELAAHLAATLALRATPVAEATEALGRNCHMPNALQTAIQVVLHVEYMSEEWTAGQQQGGGGSGGVAAGGVAAAPGALLPPDAYMWGLRLAVREGGCCASRSAYVGACLGAMVAGFGGVWAGVGALPADWLARYTAAAQVEAWAEALVQARAGGSARP